VAAAVSEGRGSRRRLVPNRSEERGEKVIKTSMPQGDLEWSRGPQSRLISDSQTGWGRLAPGNLRKTLEQHFGRVMLGTNDSSWIWGGELLSFDLNLAHCVADSRRKGISFPGGRKERVVLPSWGVNVNNLWGGGEKIRTQEAIDKGGGGPMGRSSRPVRGTVC